MFKKFASSVLLAHGTSGRLFLTAPCDLVRGRARLGATTGVKGERTAPVDHSLLHLVNYRSLYGRLQLKKIWYSALKICMGMLMIGNAAFLSLAHAVQESSTITQPPADFAATMRSCPTDLSVLQSKMEELLQSVKSSSFKETMVASLQASIPEAIAQADGLAGQITFLKQEIVRQEQERARAAAIAREGLDDPSKPLVPCRRGMEGSYCYAMDQYYVSMAANLANRAFLEALECYQRAGVR